MLLGYALLSFHLSINLLYSFQEDEPWTKRISQYESGEEPLSKRPPSKQPAATKRLGNVATAATNTTPSLHHPFPEFGTPEFSKQCTWTEYKGNTGNCTLLVRPQPGDHEGIGQFLPNVVTAHLLAQQAGCDLILDYGPGIEMTDILLPNARNWTVPRGFQARIQERSFDMHHYSNPMQVVLLGKILGTPLVYTRSFRFTYRMLESHDLYQDQFDDVKLALPGFDPETAFACSLASLFRLSPSVAQFQPDLFTRILPALYANDALTMSLYIRTGQTDVAAAKERTNASNPFREERDYRTSHAMDILHCAMEIEKQMLAENSLYSRVVWMVVTDSQDLKRWIKDTYATMSSTNTTLKRQVITTTSRGAHTRTGRDPSTSDLAEALVDWYLIGESDLVVKDGKAPSFGGTGALRTARPLYDASPKGKCRKIPTIHKRKDATSGNDKRVYNGTSADGHTLSESSTVEQMNLFSGRFPHYGTASFHRQCKWTEYKGRTGNCTLFLRPIPGGSEGISDWIAQIVTTHIYAQQAGCDLVFDYGPGTDVSPVIMPFTGSLDWSVPSNFSCTQKSRCFAMQQYRVSSPGRIKALGNDLGSPLAYAPSMRFAYHSAKHFHLFHDEFQEAKKSLLGFVPQTAMACSLGALFRLNPSSGQVEPNLFNTILSALHIDSALVMAVYIRTGKTDDVTREEVSRNISVQRKNENLYRAGAKSMLNCALQVEKQKLADSKSKFRSIWIVISDSKELKEWIRETYESKSDPWRMIVTTGSRGAQTRTNVSPSTMDLSEALLDWFLIGESDVVVSDQLQAPSFGGTAALRTARPLYDASSIGKCTLAVPVHDRTSGDVENE